ncbi:MAG TPA: patatin-like phospholipase family protein [Thermodesulfovibrionales bacterium]|nr:patatin-like phospholipase family protein [Thermodesulfovibrionales bacterium]
MSKVALVLSGGGAKGAFQFGAIKYIEEEIKKRYPDFRYKIIAGVSVGALNAVMLAMDKFADLEELWNTVSADQVYEGSLNWTAAIKIVFGAKSIMSNKPLSDRLSKIISLKDMKTDKYDLRIGAVSLVSGEYRAFRPSDFDDDEDFRSAILATTAIPVIWEPIEKIRLRNALYFEEAVDGGIRNVSPLGDVLDEDPTDVIMINCNPEKLSSDADSAKDILSIAKRSLTDITINEIFRSDVRFFLTINNLVEQARKHGIDLYKDEGQTDVYKAFKSVLIEPPDDLGDTLDFSQDVLRERMRVGYETAGEAFKDYQFTS